MLPAHGNFTARDCSPARPDAATSSRADARTLRTAVRVRHQAARLRTRPVHCGAGAAPLPRVVGVAGGSTRLEQEKRLRSPQLVVARVIAGSLTIREPRSAPGCGERTIRRASHDAERPLGCLRIGRRVVIPERVDTFQRTQERWGSYGRIAGRRFTGSHWNTCRLRRLRGGSMSIARPCAAVCARAHGRTHRRSESATRSASRTPRRRRRCRTRGGFLTREHARRDRGIRQIITCARWAIAFTSSTPACTRNDRCRLAVSCCGRGRGPAGAALTHRERGSMTAPTLTRQIGGMSFACGWCGGSVDPEIGWGKIRRVVCDSRCG